MNGSSSNIHTCRSIVSSYPVGNIPDSVILNIDNTGTYTIYNPVVITTADGIGSKSPSPESIA